MDLSRNHFQRNSSWSAPYTFSGKEKDVETGYGYFGARYFDSGLSIWLSVDPMSDKYPSMSPYNYCANNLVVLVDSDGREFNPIFRLDGEFLEDGVATLEDTNKWYREGYDQPLFADLSKLNLNILRADIQKGDKKAINVITYGSSIENFLVYGTITIKRTGDLTVKAYFDKYDFNIQNQWNPLNWVRNIEKKIAGSGVPFYIHLTGNIPDESGRLLEN